MTVRRPCPHPHCVACREGRQDFCYTGDFTERGIKQNHGYMTEFVVEEERYLNPVPRDLRDVAVLVEPLTIAEKSLEQLWMVQRRLPWDRPHPRGCAGRRTGRNSGSDGSESGRFRGQRLLAIAKSRGEESAPGRHRHSLHRRRNAFHRGDGEDGWSHRCRV